jgi:hypothetical protein
MTLYLRPVHVNKYDILCRLSEIGLLFLRRKLNDWGWFGH